jgi:biopolymer transport protein TolR
MGASMARGGGRRRKGGRRRRGLLAEINVTPFVDVMLVLLIVFMVTAPLLTSGVPLQLPKTVAKPLPTDKTPLTISVQADGSVFLQETPVAKQELLTRLTALAKEGYDQRIFVRADSDAPYGAVAEVMARINSAGYRNLGLVTDPKVAAAAADEGGGK